jgi:hypothetical protein
MAENFGLQGKDTVIKINNTAVLNAIQSFDYDAQMNPEKLRQMGDDKIAAQSVTPETSGSFENTATGSTVALLRRMTRKFDATGKSVGYLSGFETTEADYANNKGTIRGHDLENAVFDLTESKKGGEIFSESVVLPRQFLNSISMRADAQGMATENYSFVGDLYRAYPSPYHDVETLPMQYTAANKCKAPYGYVLKLSTGTPATGDRVIVHLMVNEVILPAAAIQSVTAGVNPNGDEITLAAGYTLKNSDRLSLVVYRKQGASPAAFPTISAPTSARFVKANMIDIFLIENTGSPLSGLADGSLVSHASLTRANRLLRAQNLDLNINLNRQALYQIAQTDTGNSVYHRRADYPLDITASVTQNETDLADWAKLQGKDISTFAHGDYLDLAAFEGKVWQIVARYYYKVGATVTPVQTVALCDARVDGKGHRRSSNGNAEVSWSFSGSDIVFEGVAF